MRWLGRGVACTGLGLTTTIAIAWGSAAFTDHDNYEPKQLPDYRVSNEPDDVLEMSELSTWTSVRRGWSRPALGEPFAYFQPIPHHEHPLARYQRWGAAPGLGFHQPAKLDFGMDDARGWPLLAL